MTTAEKILHVLESEKFRIWYEEKLVPCYIEDRKISKEDILKEIEKIFLKGNFLMSSKLEVYLSDNSSVFVPDRILSREELPKNAELVPVRGMTCSAVKLNSEWLGFTFEKIQQ
jgi:hypothetical protein